SGTTRGGPVNGSRPRRTRRATRRRDAAEKNHAAPRPSRKYARASPAGRSSAYGLAAPPVSDIAEKRSARSTTIASGERKSPRASRSPLLVKRKSDSSDPPLARDSGLAPPSPTATARRQKRQKSPVVAAR